MDQILPRIPAMFRFVRRLPLGLALLAGFVLPSAASATVPFTDLSAGDATYQAVETLYERGIISDDGTHLFNPRALIARDDFTSIVMEVGCERCLHPTPDLILAYTSRPFADVGFDNENFYCIARAETLGVVRGYVLDESGTTSCQDGSSHTSVPFCAANSITRIEAAAVLLRHAGFWDEIRNASDFERRYTISDVSEYWYGYAMRALDFDLVSLDAERRLSPNEYINRAEFARMAAKILQARICEESASETDERFRTSRADVDASDDGSSRWSGSSGSSGSSGRGAGTGSSESRSTGSARRYESMSVSSSYTDGTVSLRALSSASDASYRWTLRSLSGETREYTGPSLSGLDLCSAVWMGHAEAVDSAGSVAATADFSVACPSLSGGDDSSLARCSGSSCACAAGFSCSSSDAAMCSTAGRCRPVNAISVTAAANPLSPMIRENVAFSSVVSGGTGPYSYSWTFADGGLSAEAAPAHAYDTSGTRLVELSVRDSAGNVGYASVSVHVRQNDDYDGDGVNNIDDACPYVYGLASARGCPAVPTVDTTGSDTSLTTLFPTSLCQQNRLSGTAYMLGSIASCSSCPCRYRADFTAGIAACDTIVPVILSPDKQTIYSRGTAYEISAGR